MPRSDEAEFWYNAVYSAIQQIPYGKCTSYGHIALLLGFPKRARQVGVCLKHLPTFDREDPERHFHHDRNVPWHRVINSKGGISSRMDNGMAAARQVVRLRREGVEVRDPVGIEDPSVDFVRFGWFPDHLAGESSDSEVENEPNNAS